MPETTSKPTTPADVIRDTLDVMTCECPYIGVLPPAATQAWADEIVKQLNEWSMLKDERTDRRPFSIH